MNTRDQTIGRKLVVGRIGGATHSEDVTIRGQLDRGHSAERLPLRKDGNGTGKSGPLLGRRGSQHAGRRGGHRGRIVLQVLLGVGWRAFIEFALGRGWARERR